MVVWLDSFISMKTPAGKDKHQFSFIILSFGYYEDAPIPEYFLYNGKFIGKKNTSE